MPQARCHFRYGRNPRELPRAILSVIIVFPAKRRRMRLIISANGNFVRPAMLALVFLAMFSLAFTEPTYAQKEKKKKKNDVTATEAAPVIPLSDEQQIDYRISEMLGAWQLGDVDRLHQTYADDVVFVSGVWEPPVFGWANFLPLYQRQR